MSTSSKSKNARAQTGKLRIGDDWHAISIIALSQSNPLKAVAEFVENSIDAHAQHITIVRGRSGGQSYLKIIDDGDGVPPGDDGKPNFKYVATHICDSIKRQMKAEGHQGIQGEFGIGLLSFWTVGENLTQISAGSDGKAYEMRMAKGAPSYAVSPIRRLLPGGGTELTIQPLLPGIRNFSGEKLQWYLASELRDRIRQSGAEVRIVDRQARGEFRVPDFSLRTAVAHFSPRSSHRTPRFFDSFSTMAPTQSANTTWAKHLMTGRSLITATRPSPSNYPRCRLTQTQPRKIRGFDSSTASPSNTASGGQITCFFSASGEH